jgi:hypothetical protein
MLVSSFVLFVAACGGDGGDGDDGSKEATGTRRLAEAESIQVRAAFHLYDRNHWSEPSRVEIDLETSFLPDEGCTLGRGIQAQLNGSKLEVKSRGGVAEDGVCTPVQFAGWFSPRQLSADQRHGFRDEILIEDGSHRIVMELIDATTSRVFGVAGFELPRGAESWFFVGTGRDAVGGARLELFFSTKGKRSEVAFTVSNEALRRSPVGDSQTRIDFRVPADAPREQGRFYLEATSIPLQVLHCEGAACEASLDASLGAQQDHQIL